MGGVQRTVRDLLDRREVRFVTARNSVVSDLLERSPDPQVHRVWKRILDDGGLVDRSELPLVDPGDRCAAWDSAPVRYAAAQNCQLAELSVVADARRYALGVPQGALYRDQLNMAVLTLLERGKVQTLQNKWLSSSDCDHFEESVRTPDGHPPHRGLQLEEIGGVFIVFCAFLVVSVSVSVFEYCRHQRRIKGSCAPPDQPRTRSSVNCSSSSSNRASPRHDLTPSSLLQTDESISMNSSKSFDMSTYHHHHHHHQLHHHRQQQQLSYAQQHNRQTNIF